MLASFADKLIIVFWKQKLKPQKNLFYLGESFQTESVLKIRDIIPDLGITLLSFTTQEIDPIGLPCSKLDENIYHFICTPLQKEKSLNVLVKN